MTQKTSTEKLGSALLQTIEPKEIADDRMRQTVEILLNLIEQLNSRVKDKDRRKPKVTGRKQSSQERTRQARHQSQQSKKVQERLLIRERTKKR